MGGKMVNKLRYADDTVLIAENERSLTKASLISLKRKAERND